jgi:hypothetical protein
VSDLLQAALFALLGAIVGAGLTYTNARNANAINERNAKRIDDTTRSLKLSEHRLAWIQKLRDEMAIFQSWGMTPGVKQADQREFYEHGTRIELLMNPGDPDYRILQALMYRLLEAQDLNQKYSINAEFVSLCQKILKREWELAKREIRGEVI